MAKDGRIRRSFPLSTVDGLLEQLDLPAGKFDAAGSWSAEYGVYATAVGISRSGSLRLWKAAGEAAVLRVQLSKPQAELGLRRATARITCRNDELSTPRRWQFHAELLTAGAEPVLNAQIRKTAVVRGGELVLKDAAGERRIVLPRAYTVNWALLDAVGRLPRRTFKPIEFDLIDDFDQFKGEQVLSYRISQTVTVGKRKVRLHAFDPGGGGVEGIRPAGRQAIGGRRGMSASSRRITRREFLQAGAAAAAVAGGWSLDAALGAATTRKKAAPLKPNFLFIISDQLGLDVIGAHGCPDVKTPNLDRLIRRGTTFLESHSASPVCSPARSSLMTGCMPAETGVISNSRPIHPSRANVGQWFARHGYETVHCGKWHLPGGYPAKIPGFIVLPAQRGGAGQADLIDAAVSRACEAYLKNRSRQKPFLLVTSLLQPHDICYWGNHCGPRVPQELPFPQLAGKLPRLPPNHKARPKAPAKLDRVKFTEFVNEDQWRYYLYVYCRQVEMLDADVGRVLDALEASGQADNTIVVFTSDHGDGRGRHMHVSKWYPYEEAVKVPMVVSCPGRIAESLRDTKHLVTGLDVMRTFCDYAGIEAPPHARGRSLRPLLEEKTVQWREFVAADFRFDGRVIRTERYKYVYWKDDPVEQLFDMKADPWETKNLYEEAKLADVLAAHRELLKESEAQLKPVGPTESLSGRKRRRRQNQPQAK
ncbi:MAG: sulfatase family protein [Planctomycetota bacterium]